MKNDVLATAIKKWQNNPNKTLFKQNNKSILAKEFLGDISALINYWQLSLENKQKIALAVEDVYLFSCAWLALQHLGKVAVLLPNNKQGTLDELSQHYDDVVFDKDILFNKGVFIELSPKNMPTVFFTSGSTSDYQMHQRELANLKAESVAINSRVQDFELENVEVCATVSQLHLYGFSWYFFFPLMHGHVIQTQKYFAPEMIHKRLTEGGLMMITTPVILAHIDAEYAKLENTLVISSASELKENVAKDFYVRYAQEPLEVYGSTETGVIANRQQLSNLRWQCFSGVEISQNDNQQLIVESPFFKNGEQLMSDIVELSSDGRFSLNGRVDKIVKVAGKRVSLARMQNHLNQHEYVTDSVCVVRNTYREFVAAMICLSKEGKEAFEQLGKRRFTQQLNSYLLEYYDMVVLPKQWRIVENIPVNTQGKRVLADMLKEFEK